MLTNKHLSKVVNGGQIWLLVHIELSGVMIVPRLVIVLVVLTVSCGGQLLDRYLPGIGEITRRVTSTIAENPLVHFGGEVIGRGLVTSADLLTRIPLALLRASKQSGFNIPTLDSFLLRSNGHANGLTNRFLKEFNAGSGNEDANLRIDELITKYGYPVEEHKVETKDGYILTMFRIPGKGIPVFLMHGLLSCADDFIIEGPNNSLAYLLADRGYDVWFGNARGNKHSRSHQVMSPSNPEFWDFTWHEIGVHDLPAMVNYVLEHTRFEKIKYIGHSQGTTAFFVFLSERPEYNEKILQMVALSPVAFMGKVRSPIVRLLAPGGPAIYSVTRTLGIHELLPDDDMMKALKIVMCGQSAVSEIICNNIVFLIAGFDFRLLNVEALPVLLGHLPAGCSMKQLVHYAQGIVSREFRQFDHGYSKNMKVYGTSEPPRYELQKITVPISLFYSDEDWLAHQDDVEMLYQSLGNQNDNYKIYFPGFNHMDFVHAKYFSELVFPKIEFVFQINDKNNES